MPIIVLLLYVAFALTPLAGGGLELAGARRWALARRARAIFRCWGGQCWRWCWPIRPSSPRSSAPGLQSVDLGQIEAAKALGLNGWQRFRHIVFPQAFRTILPPLGNDFVAMVKDSSLVSVLGVADITQLGKVTAAGNFRYFETYNVVALIYLTMTITLSLVLRRLETRMRSGGERRIRCASGGGLFCAEASASSGMTNAGAMTNPLLGPWARRLHCRPLARYATTISPRL